MIESTRMFYFVFSLLTLIGGLIGFLKAGSKASLIAGGISGVLLGVAAVLIGSNTTVGLILGLVVSLALAGRFVPAMMKGGKFMPAGMMSILSVISVALTVVALVKK